MLIAEGHQCRTRRTRLGGRVPIVPLYDPVSPNMGDPALPGFLLKIQRNWDAKCYSYDRNNSSISSRTGRGVWSTGTQRATCVHWVFSESIEPSWAHHRGWPAWRTAENPGLLEGISPSKSKSSSIFSAAIRESFAIHMRCSSYM